MTDLVHYYFAYGSNMNPVRVEQRNMSFHSAESGSLQDYALRFNKRSVKYPGAASANVVATEHAITEGVVYRLIDPGQIETMDPYEGYPRRYNRVALPIKVDSGMVDAWVYIANDEYITEGLLPARWYLEHLLAGEAYLTADYHCVLQQIHCMPNSDKEPG